MIEFVRAIHKHVEDVLILDSEAFLIMKQGNSNRIISTCSCVSLQLHLLSAPKSLFSERQSTPVMSIIVFIALAASFSLKNLPISEKKFLPLFAGIGLGTFLFRHQKVLNFSDIRKSLCHFLCLFPNYF